MGPDSTADGQITREQMIKAAENAIQAAETRGVPASEGLKADLMKIAQETPVIAGGWWIEEKNCGCLIATYRRGLG
jgi:hypothetical protein